MLRQSEQRDVRNLRPFGAGTRCKACGNPFPEGELDEASWCPVCREALERTARRTPHIVATAIVAPFAVWIVVGGQFAVLPWYAWLLPLAAAYYLGFRIGRESVKGYVRWKRSREPGVR